MIKLKFVDIKHVDNPQLWDKHTFAVAKCHFEGTGIATILCPAIKQIMSKKGILYLCDADNEHFLTNAYVLTSCNKEKTGIIMNCKECKFRER